MEELRNEDWHKLADEARRVFAGNEVDFPGLYFHMPSSRFYPSLFAWDSGFHAAALVHLDARKAARELETLFSQVAPDGHMPHETLVACPATHRRRIRNFTRWIVQWEYDSCGRSHLVDPPSFVYAAELVYDVTGDDEWLSRIWEGMSMCLDYLLDERDLFGDGLISILHPWEAGTDLSPQFLPVLGIDPTLRSHRLRATVYAPLLYHFNTRMSWDPSRLGEANRFVVEDLTMNCLAIRALRSASRLAGALGDDMAASRYRSRAERMAEALDALCWDDDDGCYFPRWDVKNPRLSRVKTAQSLMPLFAGLCEEQRLKRLVEEHLLLPGEFWSRYLLPFNPEDELQGSQPWAERNLWSGHCIWININWMAAIGLGEHGYEAEARELTGRTVRMVLDSGFWEYYDSRTGQGRRVEDFNWPALSLDMMARFWPETVDRGSREVDRHGTAG